MSDYALTEVQWELAKHLVPVLEVRSFSGSLIHKCRR